MRIAHAASFVRITFHIAWIGRPIMLGFAIVAAGMLGHAIRALWDPRINLEWSFAILVIAINFGTFSAALWLLA